MRHIFFAINLMFVMLVATLSWADTIELKTGQKVDGTFRQATAAGVVVEVGGQVLTFPLDQVRAIYFGSAPTSAAASTTGPDEALGALRGLESVVKSGVNYQEFSKRVLDARVVVDRALRGNDAPKLREAMQLYELAAKIWRLRMTSGFGGVLDDAAVGFCPAALEDAKKRATATINATAARTKKPAQSLTPLDIEIYFVGHSSGVINGVDPILLACASQRLQ
jgi:hypothetical protein